MDVTSGGRRRVLIAVAMELAALASGCTTRRIWIALPDLDHHPIEVAVAEGVRPGMTVDEVTRLVGAPGVFGAGVTPTSGDWAGPSTYHVHWDSWADHDIANGTWIYVIRSPAGASDAAPWECLFIHMQDGRASQVYKGRIAGWSM